MIRRVKRREKAFVVAWRWLVEVIGRDETILFVQLMQIKPRHGRLIFGLVSGSKRHLNKP